MYNVPLLAYTNPEKSSEELSAIHDLVVKDLLDTNQNTSDLVVLMRGLGNSNQTITSTNYNPNLQSYWSNCFSEAMLYASIGITNTLNNVEAIPNICSNLLIMVQNRQSLLDSGVIVNAHSRYIFEEEHISERLPYIRNMKGEEFAHLFQILKNPFFPKIDNFASITDTNNKIAKGVILESYAHNIHPDNRNNGFIKSLILSDVHKSFFR